MPLSMSTSLNFETSFLNDCKKANNELSLYIKNELKEDDFKSLGKIGHGGDIIKQIDKFAEDIFVKHLLKYSDILSEESGLIKSKNITNNDYLMILDPIDGSDNLLSSLPYYCTSIALQKNNITIIAFIYNLVNDEYYFKSNTKHNIKCLNTYKSNIGIFERAYTKGDIVKKLEEKNLKFRSPGATALSMANTNNYEFFLFAGKARIQDVCAGLFICKELNIYQSNNFLLISKNKSIFNTIKEIIKES